MRSVPIGRTIYRRKRNKFHVAPKEKRTLNGVLFASAGEMQRHQDLQILQLAKKISGLERQVPIVLTVDENDKALLTWVVDWQYIDNGQIIVEDFTGVMTPLKRTKIRMCAAIFPDFVIRISRMQGSGRNKHIVVADCIKGKIPPLKPRVVRTRAAK